jgi:NADP-dependent 3-hydroxy acid dehydrogenase YdfG
MGKILITGAAGGIGTALTAELAGAGHEVTGLCRDQGGRAKLEAIGARAVVADLADPAGLATSLAGPSPRLDALVHCAGVADIDAVADAEPGTWQRVLTVNVAAAAELTRLMLPALRRAHGHVVFVNATPGMRAVPRWSAFVASKAALRELADALRAEEEGHRVRVTTVYPAGTATEHLRSIRGAFGRPYDPQLCIQPASLALMIAWVLAAPPDAYPSELSVLPGPHPAQPG